MTQENEKARRYIGLLDAARCNGDWVDVPELVRKVTKHAPHRTCLILTANTELSILKYTARASSVRPSTPKSQASELSHLIPPLLSEPESQSQASELSRLIPPLLSELESQSHPIEDVFQGQTCLGWIHWLLSEPGLAASSLPKNIMALFQDISEAQKRPSDYVITCMLKCMYMKGSYQIEEVGVSEGLKTFGLAVPWIHKYNAKLLSQALLSLWSEQLLARMALAASDGLHVSSPGTKERTDTALRAFRDWATFSSHSKDTAQEHLGLATPTRRRIEIWEAYYLFLSKLLQQGIDHSASGEKRTRFHQAAELRRVESMYESELLSRTKFPTANDSNRAIEEWVEQVIRNWKVLSGKSWPEAELGEGGGNAYGRNVLDVLYRAATKTFHSTLILRHLFHVHLSLADFDLAYKALDSYLELVTRGKARASKSHHTPTGIDDDGTVLRTISEAVEGLCSFGRKDEAGKVHRLISTLEEWTKEYFSRRTSGKLDSTSQSGPYGDDQSDTKSDECTLEATQRAIGIGKAFWAMWTPASEQRSTYQGQALAHLSEAAVALPDVPPSLETAYAQALLLAETRDLNKAIDCTRKSLSIHATGGAGHYGQQYKAVPLWHLLALLQSARQDFSSAYQMCGAALDQFDDSDPLFGDAMSPGNGSVTGDDDRAWSGEWRRGRADDMDPRDMQRLIEVKMTELVLIETFEGAEEALNTSNELLSLFSKLFGRLGVGKAEKPKPTILIPPKSAAGTVKSLRGSIFSRRRHILHTFASKKMENRDHSLPGESFEPQSIPSKEAPIIQVTDADSRPQKERSLPFRRSHSHSRGDAQSHKLHKKEVSKTSIIHRHSKPGRTEPTSNVISSQRPSFEADEDQLSPKQSVIKRASNEASRETSAKKTRSTASDDNAPTIDGRRLHSSQIPESKSSLPAVAQNIGHTKALPPSGHEKQPPKQEARLPNVRPFTTPTQPAPRFPQVAEQIQAHAILVKVWLLIAGLYRRASLFDDSKEACDEASTSASQVESLVATQEPSAAAFSDAGWGGGKSSNDLWADVYTERAYLAQAQGAPHEAIKHFEEALIYFLDHPQATVGLSNILLDIFEQKTPGEAPRPGLDLETLGKQNHHQQEAGKRQDGSSLGHGVPEIPRTGEDLRKTPENLNRLAARDRAYGLLSNLTKLGTSWDDSEAWYALARAHECSGQVEKAKEVLWWCVELEDKRPVRHWRDIGPGSYVL